jgi:hypothetical protein
MSEDIDITDLLHLLEEHPLETIGTIARLAIREIKRLRQKVHELCAEIEELEAQHAEPA